VAGHLIGAVGVPGYPAVPPVPADPISVSGSLCVQTRFGVNGAMARLATVERVALAGGRPTGGPRSGAGTAAGDAAGDAGTGATGPGGEAGRTAGGSVSGGAGSDATPADRRPDPRVADLVTVPVDGGALVADQVIPGLLGSARYLLTELGVKYPLTDTALTGTLGLGGVRFLGVPGDLLAFLPTGPTLDPGAALTEQPWR